MDTMRVNSPKFGLIKTKHAHRVQLFINFDNTVTVHKLDYFGDI